MTSLRRFSALSLGFVALGLSAAHGCGGEPNGPALTVAASSTSVTSVGAGGTGPGGGGAGGEDPSTTTTTTSGMGGQGGGGEQPIHGCTSALAVDMTGAAVTVNLPAGPFCVRMSQEATMVKIPDLTSPIASCCDTSPYTCCPVTSDPITMSTVGAFPWYDDKSPSTLRGVVYVE